MLKQIIICLSLVCVVSSAQQERVVLIEEFSSSTCPPCKTFNETVLSPFLASSNMEKVTVVNYRMNWPSKGDPYYTEEAGKKKSLYAVTGVPDCYIDGKKQQAQTNDAFTKAVTTAAIVAAKADITATHTIDGSSVAQGNVTVAVTIKPKLDIENAILYIAVVEKKTTKNAATNGEKEFHYVMMKMVPDASGKALTLKANAPVSVTEKASLAGTHIEEMTDLVVVAWIQTSSKEVIQSTWSKLDQTSITSKQQVLNPYRGTAPNIKGHTIYNAKNSQIEIYTLSGICVWSQNCQTEVFVLPQQIQMSQMCIIKVGRKGAVFTLKHLILQ